MPNWLAKRRHKLQSQASTTSHGSPSLTNPGGAAALSSPPHQVPSAIISVPPVPSPAPLSTGQRWTQAAEKLRTSDDKGDVYVKLVESLQTLNGPQTTIYTDLSFLLSENVDLVCDRQWKLKWGSSRFRVRAIVDSVSSFLGTVKDIAKTAAMLDPAHAGIPVAVFCVLLPTISGLTEQEDAAFGGIEAATTIVNHYIAFEKAIDHELAGAHGTTLETSLVDLYALILEFMVVTNCFFQHKTLTRYLRAVPKLDDFNKLLKEITEQDNNCRRLIDTVQQSEIREDVKQIKKLTQSILDARKERDSDQTKVLLWLSDVKYGADLQSILSKLDRYTRSGEWLRQSWQYDEWQRRAARRQNVLWLRGHVGTGKTSLTSILIRQHLESIQPSSVERVAYVFCSNKATAPDNLRFVKCLISQFSWNNDGRSLNDAVMDLYRVKDDPAGSGLPNQGKCQELLLQLLQQCSKNTIYVDALDECSEEELDVLLDVLRYAVQNATCQISLFLTSRMHIPVSSLFTDCLIIDPSGNRGDVLKYIETEISIHHHKFLGGSRPDLEQRLTQALAQRSENVFRWVELQLSTFLSRKSRLTHVGDVEAKIEVLESDISDGIPDLNKVYDEIHKMNTPQPRIRKLADKVMRWLLLSYIDLGARVVDQPPRQAIEDMAGISNLLAAVSLQEDGSKDPNVSKSLILDVCSNLVLEDEQEGRFQFAHLSVVEYLLSRHDAVTNCRDMTIATVSSNVVVASLSLLLSLTHQKSESTSSDAIKTDVPAQPKRRPYARRCSSHVLPPLRISFAQFAIIFWPLYYRVISKESRSRTLNELFAKVMLTDTTTSYFKYWQMSYGQQLWGGMNRLRNSIDDGQATLKSRGGQTSSPPTSFVNPATLASAKGESVTSRAFAAAVYDFREVMYELPEAELTTLNMEGRNCLAVAQAWGRDVLVKFLRDEKGLSIVTSNRLRSDQMGLHLGRNSAYSLSPSFGVDARSFNDRFRGLAVFDEDDGGDDD